MYCVMSHSGTKPMANQSRHSHAVRRDPLASKKSNVAISVAGRIING